MNWETLQRRLPSSFFNHTLLTNLHLRLRWACHVYYHLRESSRHRFVCVSYTVLCTFTLTVAQDYLSTTRKANTTSSISSAMDIVIDTSNMNVEPPVLFHHFASLSSHLCNESQQFSRMTSSSHPIESIFPNNILYHSFNCYELLNCYIPKKEVGRGRRHFPHHSHSFLPPTSWWFMPWALLATASAVIHLDHL